ncbi:repetitive organellar protein-like [Prorops nasuta]|uniref:repetitive organellar protein-like n=1 Tax=Prorops nasuta TaxID=863751 RepID=UPI0034CFC933
MRTRRNVEQKHKISTRYKKFNKESLLKEINEGRRIPIVKLIRINKPVKPNTEKVKSQKLYVLSPPTINEKYAQCNKNHLGNVVNVETNSSLIDKEEVNSIESENQLKNVCTSEKKHDGEYNKICNNRKIIIPLIKIDNHPALLKFNRQKQLTANILKRQETQNDQDTNRNGKLTSDESNSITHSKLSNSYISALSSKSLDDQNDITKANGRKQKSLETRDSMVKGQITKSLGAVRKIKLSTATPTNKFKNFTSASENKTVTHNSLAVGLSQKKKLSKSLKKSSIQSPVVKSIKQVESEQIKNKKSVEESVQHHSPILHQILKLPKNEVLSKLLSIDNKKNSLQMVKSLQEIQIEGSTVKLLFRKNNLKAINRMPGNKRRQQNLQFTREPMQKKPLVTPTKAVVLNQNNLLKERNDIAQNDRPEIILLNRCSSSYNIEPNSKPSELCTNLVPNTNDNHSITKAVGKNNQDDINGCSCKMCEKAQIVTDQIKAMQDETRKVSKVKCPFCLTWSDSFVNLKTHITNKHTRCELKKVVKNKTTVTPEMSTNIPISFLTNSENGDLPDYIKDIPNTYTLTRLDRNDDTCTYLSTDFVMDFPNNKNLQSPLISDRQMKHTPQIEKIKSVRKNFQDVKKHKLKNVANNSDSITTESFSQQELENTSEPGTVETISPQKVIVERDKNKIIQKKQPVLVFDRQIKHIQQIKKINSVIINAQGVEKHDFKNIANNSNSVVTESDSQYKLEATSKPKPVETISSQEVVVGKVKTKNIQKKQPTFVSDREMKHSQQIEKIKSAVKNVQGMDIHDLKNSANNGDSITTESYSQQKVEVTTEPGTVETISPQKVIVERDKNKIIQKKQPVLVFDKQIKHIQQIKKINSVVINAQGVEKHFFKSCANNSNSIVTESNSQHKLEVTSKPKAVEKISSQEVVVRKVKNKNNQNKQPTFVNDRQMKHSQQIEKIKSVVKNVQDMDIHDLRNSANNNDSITSEIYSQQELEVTSEPGTVETISPQKVIVERDKNKIIQKKQPVLVFDKQIKHIQQIKKINSVVINAQGVEKHFFKSCANNSNSVVTESDSQYKLEATSKPKPVETISPQEVVVGKVKTKNIQKKQPTFVSDREMKHSPQIEKIKSVVKNVQGMDIHDLKNSANNSDSITTESYSQEEVEVTSEPGTVETISPQKVIVERDKNKIIQKKQPVLVFDRQIKHIQQIKKINSVVINAQGVEKHDFKSYANNSNSIVTESDSQHKLEVKNKPNTVEIISPQEVVGKVKTKNIQKKQPTFISDRQMKHTKQIEEIKSVGKNVQDMDKHDLNNSANNSDSIITESDSQQEVEVTREPGTVETILPQAVVVRKIKTKNVQQNQNKSLIKSTKAFKRQCDICKAKFLYNISYQRHLLKHTRKAGTNLNYLVNNVSKVIPSRVAMNTIISAEASVNINSSSKISKLKEKGNIESETNLTNFESENNNVELHPPLVMSKTVLEEKSNRVNNVNIKEIDSNSKTLNSNNDSITYRIESNNSAESENVTSLEHKRILNTDVSTGTALSLNNSVKMCKVDENIAVENLENMSVDKLQKFTKHNSDLKKCFLCEKKFTSQKGMEDHLYFLHDIAYGDMMGTEFSSMNSTAKINNQEQTKQKYSEINKDTKPEFKSIVNYKKNKKGSRSFDDTLTLSNFVKIFGKQQDTMVISKETFINSLGNKEVKQIILSRNQTLNVKRTVIKKIIRVNNDKEEKSNKNKNKKEIKLVSEFPIVMPNLSNQVETHKNDKTHLAIVKKNKRSLINDKDRKKIAQSVTFNSLQGSGEQQNDMLMNEGNLNRAINVNSNILYPTENSTELNKMKILHNNITNKNINPSNKLHKTNRHACNDHKHTCVDSYKCIICNEIQKNDTELLAHLEQHVIKHLFNKMNMRSACIEYLEKREISKLKMELEEGALMRNNSKENDVGNDETSMRNNSMKNDVEEDEISMRNSSKENNVENDETSIRNNSMENDVNEGETLMRDNSMENKAKEDETLMRNSSVRNNVKENQVSRKKRKIIALNSKSNKKIKLDKPETQIASSIDTTEIGQIRNLKKKQCNFEETQKILNKRLRMTDDDIIKKDDIIKFKYEETGLEAIETKEAWRVDRNLNKTTNKWNQLKNDPDLSTKCLLCDLNFDSAKDLYEHLYRLHNIRYDDESEKECTYLNTNEQNYKVLTNLKSLNAEEIFEAENYVKSDIVFDYSEDYADIIQDTDLNISGSTSMIELKNEDSQIGLKKLKVSRDKSEQFLVAYLTCRLFWKYKCVLCNLVYHSLSRTKYHLWKIHKISAGMCHLCRKIYYSQHMAYHILSCHFVFENNLDCSKKNKNETHADIINIEEYIKEIDARQLSSMCNYEKYTHTSKSFQCDACESSFNSLKMYTDHLMRLHDRNCILCNKSFSNVRQAIHHKYKKHFSQRIYLWVIKQIMNAVLSTNIYGKTIEEISNNLQWSLIKENDETINFEDFVSPSLEHHCHNDVSSLNKSKNAVDKNVDTSDLLNTYYEKRHDVQSVPENSENSENNVVLLVHEDDLALHKDDLKSFVGDLCSTVSLYSPEHVTQLLHNYVQTKEEEN